MLKPPFIVENYFFPHIDISADANFDPKVDQLPPAFNVKVSVSKDEQSDIYQVALEIKLEPENEDKRQPYSISLVEIGLFRFVQPVPDQEKLLRINGASILYSAAREYLFTVTARGPWGPIMLPTCSFLEEAEKDLKVEKKRLTKKGSASKAYKVIK